MTVDEYRRRILDSEAWIALDLERKQRELLCKLQAKNRTYIKNPALVTYTLAYEALREEARVCMQREADAVETQYYNELEEDQ